MKTLILYTLALLLFAHRVGAQSLTIHWYKIANGGGTATAGNYSVTATIGQHDAKGLSADGSFSLFGGFWALSAVQRTGAPTLGLWLTSTNTPLVYWPSPSTGFNPAVSANLGGTNWTGVSETVDDNGTIRYFLVRPPTGNRAYRLQNP